MNLRRAVRGAMAGMVIVAAYLLIAGLTFRLGWLPVRPFYEGIAPPQPYRWVNPPPELASENEKPESGSGTVAFGDQNSQQEVIVTNDGQALLSVHQGSFKLIEGETEITISITPLDPAKLGAAPGGLKYDSNAYKFEATYQPSGATAQFTADSCPPNQLPKICPTLVLRTARGATTIFRREGASWSKLPSNSAGASLQLFTDVNELGTFVAAGHFVAASSPSFSRYVAIGLALLAIIGAGLFSRVRATRRSLRRNSTKARSRFETRAVTRLRRKWRRNRRTD